MFASDVGLVDYLRARQWNGQMPATLITSGNGAGSLATLLQVPTAVK